MKRAKSQIIQTSRGNSKYYFSILQKENDSGILFNQRLFYLLSGQHIGYISDVKPNQTPQQINFEKPKITVLLTNIKSIVVNLTQLSIKFNLIDGNKKSERTWILRMEKEELTRQWYDLLQREKISSTSSKALSPKKTEPPEAWRLSPQKVESPEKKKEFVISRHLELSENTKQPREFKEIGIGVSPKNAETKKIEFKDPQEKLKNIMQQSPKKIESQKPIERPVQRLIQKPVQKPVEKPVQKPVEKPVQKPVEKPVQKPIERPMEKSSQLTLLNTSRKNISEYDRSQQERTSRNEVKPMLVNTKYLNNQNKEKSGRSKDYLDRTHELIKSIEIEKGNKSKSSIILLKQIQQQNKSAPQIVASKAVRIDKSQNWSDIPWTFKYVKYDHLIFKEFEAYTQQLMTQLIIDQSHRKDAAKFKPKLIKNGVYYYDIADLEVKLAFIGLQDIDSSAENIETERVCNKKAVKNIENQFNNFKALYEYLGNKQKLRVPLISLCSYNGFVALFKTVSKSLKKSIRFKEIQYELSQLQKRSKIHGNFIQSVNNVIIQLDEGYYDKLKQEDDDKINFNLFFIQEIEQFLLPDLITDSPQERGLILRKELIDNYRIDAPPINKELSLLKGNRSKPGFSKELQSFSRSILVAISEVILQLDSFRIFFLNSSEFSDFLHTKGVNLRYIGHLYENLRTIFQRRFVMTEIAARSCKSLFRKTLQDLATTEEAPQGQELHCKICDFLNCVLGNTFQTAAIWRVLSTHAKSYFGLELNFDEIDRGHFVISLIENLKLTVVWDKIKPQEAFKSSIFFSEKNLIGLAMHSKSYNAVFTNAYLNTLKILEREQSFSGFETLVNDLDLKNNGIPAQLAFIETDIRRYLSFFISPSHSQEYKQLVLYEGEDEGPSRLKFDLLLMRIKWALRQKEREEYIKVCDIYIRTATKYFGEFHPIFSELYELFSAYHLGNSQFQDAVTFAKSSLVNILKVCGSNHERTAECYFHLALCYIKNNRREEGAAHIRKSLSILEANGRTQTVPYAVMQVKLGLLLLNQGQVEQCVRQVASAQSVFEIKAAEGYGSFQDEITQCLQMLNRCYELLQWRAQSRELLTECEMRLNKTLQAHNLQKILKIYLHPLLAGLSPQQASHYLDIISTLGVTHGEEECQKAVKLIRERILEGSFRPCLQTYFSKLENIEQHVREKGMLRGWQNFSEIYERQTVKDFLALTVQLLTFLGVGFISGALREAL